MSDAALWGLLLAVSAVLVILALLSLLTLGSVRLHSILGVLRDGPVIGSQMPSFLGTDAVGGLVELPVIGKWHLVLFGHQGLKEFPEVVDAVAEFVESGRGEVSWLARDTGDPDGRAAALSLNLRTAPTFVDAGVYGYYNVRAIPFVVVVDPTGRVRGRGLVNHRATLLAIWERARAETIPAPVPVKA